MSTNENGILTIQIDLSQDHGPSKSGKTIVVASTQGNQKVDNSEVIIGINCYKYPE